VGLDLDVVIDVDLVAVVCLYAVQAHDYDSD
jgi:hypothetical protein